MVFWVKKVCLNLSAGKLLDISFVSSDFEEWEYIISVELYRVVCNKIVSVRSHSTKSLLERQRLEEESNSVLN